MPWRRDALLLLFVSVGDGSRNLFGKLRSESNPTRGLSPATGSAPGPFGPRGIPSIAHRSRAREDGVGNNGRSPMWRIAIIAGCLIVGAAPAFAQDKATIVKLNDAWAAAFNKGDASAVAAMYTEDAFVLPPGTEMVKGRAAIEAFWRQAAQQMGDAKFTTIDVLALGPGNHRQIRRRMAQGRRQVEARNRHLEHEQMSSVAGIRRIRTRPIRRSRRPDRRRPVRACRSGRARSRWCRRPRCRRGRRGRSARPGIRR